MIKYRDKKRIRLWQRLEYSLKVGDCWNKAIRKCSPDSKRNAGEHFCKLYR